MTIADMINGGFEIFGGVAVLGHCKALHRDKQVKGVSVVATAFFCGWGYWNLWYYPSLGQWMSFVGGIGVTVANTVWVALLIWYGAIKPRRQAKLALAV